MKKDYLAKNLNKHNNDFVEYVFDKDESVVILKSHLYLEQVINKSIGQLVKNPKYILEGSFKKKCEFLYAIGFIGGEVLRGLLKLNSVRNKFSHEYGYKLTHTDVHEISQLTKIEISIPTKLLTFPRAKEALTYSTVASNFITLLELLNISENEQEKELLQDVSDTFLKT